MTFSSVSLGLESINPDLMQVSCKMSLEHLALQEIKQVLREHHTHTNTHTQWKKVKKTWEPTGQLEVALLAKIGKI